MPRPRSTPFAILGLLGFAPMSGYDIRKETASSVGYFWSESYGQIYPALRDLAAAGLIRRRPGRMRRGRDRRVYEITARGRVALREWKRRPPGRAPVRNELLLKLFFADASSVAVAAGWIAELLAEETARLATFRGLRRQLRAERRGHPSLPFWLATLGYGEHRSRAVVRWCRETGRSLKRATGEAAGDAPARAEARS